jgi:hypothetical protein
MRCGRRRHSGRRSRRLPRRLGHLGATRRERRRPERRSVRRRRPRRSRSRWDDVDGRGRACTLPDARRLLGRAHPGCRPSTRTLYRPGSTPSKRATPLVSVAARCHSKVAWTRTTASARSPQPWSSTSLTTTNVEVALGLRSHGHERLGRGQGPCERATAGACVGACMGSSAGVVARVPCGPGSGGAERRSSRWCKSQATTTASTARSASPCRRLIGAHAKRFSRTAHRRQSTRANARGFDQFLTCHAARCGGAYSRAGAFEASPWRRDASNSGGSAFSTRGRPRCTRCACGDRPCSFRAPLYLEWKLDAAGQHAGSGRSAPDRAPNSGDQRILESRSGPFEIRFSSAPR